MSNRSRTRHANTACWPIFPDPRTVVRAHQTLLLGPRLQPRTAAIFYASMASLTDPVGDSKGATGNGILVYGFADGKITPEQLIPLPLQQLAVGRTTRLIGEGASNKGVPYPAAIAVIGAAGAEKLLVADNLSDDVLLLDAASGKIERRFDLSETDASPRNLPHCPGGHERWRARLCRPVERVGDRRT